MKSQNGDEEESKCTSFVPIVQDEPGLRVNFDECTNDDDRDKMAYIPLVSIQGGEGPPVPEKKEPGVRTHLEIVSKIAILFYFSLYRKLIHKQINLLLKK